MRLILVDAKNQLYRMHHQPNLNALSTEEGFPTGAIFGCLSYSLLSMATKFPDSAIVWCWDGAGDTWRHKLMANTPRIHFKMEEKEEDASESMYDEYRRNMSNMALEHFGMYMQPQKKKKKHIGYKANRVHKEVKGKKDGYPVDQRQRALIQIPILKLILNGIGIRNYEVDGLECDDLIGIITKKALKMDCEVIILSGDRDFYQLLKYNDVKLIKGTKGGKVDWVDAVRVLEDHSIRPIDWAKYRAFTGDSSDNIPHLWKVGPATAKKMLADGLDPSNSNWEHIPFEAREKYIRYFSPGGYEKLWPSVHMNYKICRIITNPDDDLLPEEVKEKLAALVNKITKPRHFCRDTKVQTAEGYRRVSYLMSQYELNEARARIDDLWKIP